jgi:hypothetical protein
MLYDREDDLPWHGEVKFENDEYSTDDWFKNTGWYSIKINGHQKHYPLLLYALLAYDGNELNICKINKINEDMSKLNLPQLHCNDLVNNHSKMGEDLITNYLPPPKYSAAIDHVGPIFRNQNNDGPCYLTKTQSNTSEDPALHLATLILSNCKFSRSVDKIYFIT